MIDVRGIRADLANTGEPFSIHEVFEGSHSLVEILAAKLEPVLK